MHELVSIDEPISLNKKNLSCQYRLIPVDIQARKHMDNAGDLYNSICQGFFFFFFCVRMKRRKSIATQTTGTKQDESVYNYTYSKIQRYKFAVTIK